MILGSVLPDLMKDQSRVDAMYWLLGDLTEEQFKVGIQKLILKHPQIYPGTNIIALIREYALIDDEIPSPEEAWGQVKGHFGRAHTSLSEFTSEALHMMGYENIKWNIIRNENEEIDRAHFFKTYKAITERAKNELLMGDR